MSSTSTKFSNLTPEERFYAVANSSTGVASRIQLPSDIFVDHSSEPFAASLGSQTSDEMITVSLLMGALSDAFMRNISFPNYIYILGDNSILNACYLYGKKFHKEELSSARVSNTIEKLSFCGLIYRFNVAMKFGYPPRGVYQLRLNSWGRHTNKKLIEMHSEDYAAMLEFFSEIIATYSKSYQKLIDLCSQPDDAIDVNTLHSINKQLEIQVVT